MGSPAVTSRWAGAVCFTRSSSVRGMLRGAAWFAPIATGDLDEDE
jgi:hypothetical protein